MKTFQIFKNVSYEYFIEAETLEEAQNWASFIQEQIKETRKTLAVL